jgi:DNA-binding NarL/FixJ family response regulator
MIENIVVIHDLETNQVIERQMTDDEIADRNKIQVEYKQKQDELKAQSETRKSALQKLAALGLTDKEIASLIN